LPGAKIPPAGIASYFVSHSKPPRVELICVGTELLTGKTNTHGATLAQRLEAAGLVLARETTVGDDPVEMRAAFAEAWRHGGVILCTGGLGPTFDDITRDVWSRVTGRRLLLQPAIAREIEEKFRRRGLRMPPDNRRQACVLRGARVLVNAHGTAPGQMLSIGNKTLVLLPGPGREMTPIFDRDVFPVLRGLHPGARDSRIYRVYGVPESAIDERMRPLVRRHIGRGGVDVVWGILAQGFIVDIKFAVSGNDPTAVRRTASRVEADVLRRFGKNIYGRGRETLEESVGRLLSAKKRTLALAESCTGGLLSQKITRVPGSSAYFLQGLVTYSNQAKERLLGVRRATLAKHGAVSKPAALAMARGARRRAGADYGMSVTGIAGPEGGTAEKPVGLVYIALDGPGGAVCVENRFPGGREQVRERAALAALDLLRRRLLGV